MTLRPTDFNSSSVIKNETEAFLFYLKIDKINDEHKTQNEKLKIFLVSVAVIYVDKLK